MTEDVNVRFDVTDVKAPESQLRTVLEGLELVPEIGIRVEEGNTYAVVTINKASWDRVDDQTLRMRLQSAGFSGRFEMIGGQRHGYV